MKKGDAVTFTTKYGDRATGIYEGPYDSPGPGDSLIHGHVVNSDDCFGPDHSSGVVRCFLPSLPQALAGEEAAKVLKRFE